jgi:glycosyltransferase involved in cell wall biosynthesis
MAVLAAAVLRSGRAPERPCRRTAAALEWDLHYSPITKRKRTPCIDTSGALSDLRRPSGVVELPACAAGTEAVGVTDAKPAAPLKILFVTSDTFPPFRPAAKAIFAEELARRGHRIDWLLQAESPKAPHGTQGFGNGTAFVAATDGGGSRWRRVRKTLLSLRNDCRIFGLLKRGQYSLVQAKDVYLAGILALLAAKRYRVPFLYWLAYPHADFYLYAARIGTARYRFFYYLRGAAQKFLLLKIIVPAAQHVFVQSEQMRKDLAAEGVPFEKMTPVPSSLNLDGMTAEPGSPPIQKPPGERWILYLGTLVGERHLDFLVRVLAAVREAVPKTKLLLVGAGERPWDEEALRREAERVGVADSLVITGWLPMQRGWEYVRAADVCLSPYFPIPMLRSTSPTKLIEYMALRKAVVANDHPEQTLVVSESGAGIVTPWEERAFADAVVHLLQHEQEARAMGDAGRVFVERHRTHRHMADVVENRYRAVLAETPASDGRAAFGFMD